MNVTTFLPMVNIIAPSKNAFSWFIQFSYVCLVDKKSYSKTIILTEIFIIIYILSMSNKVLKYFLNHTKTFKKVVTSNAYSLTYKYDFNSMRMTSGWLGQCSIMKVFCNFRVFLMNSKVIKGKWHQNETPSVYSYWTKALSWKFSEWCNVVYTTF